MTQKKPDPTTESTERASGTIDRPIGTGDAQPGDFAERAAELGGPVDIFPTRRDRSGLEPWRSTDGPGEDEAPKS
ncbi:hypothetical protein JMJ55_22385 [Belnapia sp. T6]|uniref:Uncharacterized protein n=1 Tax=Belnapia mucosa TaxID=2804532 RepID=A0ABS1VBH8_9PROT|nr:hypothetical protein [Belnapia mucosa]MBL6458089.1 hypothetical protein [Belnapia mucosa]